MTETPTRYRKKPVEIEAMVFDGTPVTATPIIDWALANGVTINFRCDSGEQCRRGLHDLRIPTLEGAMTASPGDVIIRGVQGEFYPCKPDIFAATYAPPADDKSGRYEDFDSFDAAQHDAVIIQDARFDVWVAFQTDGGDWLAVRPRNEGEEPSGEDDDRWRPLGPEDVEGLSYPISVVETATAFGREA
jgi:hypothetical protein